MSNKIREQRERIKRLQSEMKDKSGEIQRAEDELKRLEVTCGHDWSEPEYDPIVTEGYESPGDPPGTMGIDWRGPCWVPGTREDRWRRTCRKCGKTQVTTSSETVESKKPRFGNH